MNVVITGGAGFLGKKLAQSLLDTNYIEIDNEKRPLGQITLFDKVAPDGFADGVQVITGDISNKEAVENALGNQPDVIFHLASVVSGEAEENFELGTAVNLQGTQNILEHCRQLPMQSRLIFTSSVATYGANMPDIIEDDTAVFPLSSYGTQKAACELLINDYSRREFVNGRVLRLPTIVVRPGKPNKATSTFASSIIREPLQGETAVCPVTPETRLWVLSPRQAVKSLLHGANIPDDDWGNNRILMLPGLSVSVTEMLDELSTYGGNKLLARIQWLPNALIQQIVGSWPTQFNPKRATALGFAGDEDFASILKAFIEDDFIKPKKDF